MEEVITAYVLDVSGRAKFEALHTPIISWHSSFVRARFVLFEDCSGSKRGFCRRRKRDGGADPISISLHPPDGLFPATAF